MEVSVLWRSVEFVWNLVSFRPSGLSVIERCPHYRYVRKERFDCNLFECKNILLAKNTACFTTFIQTAVGRQLSSPNSLSDFECLMAKHATFNSQSDNVFTSRVDA